MSISNVNLRKQIGDWFSFNRGETVTQEVINEKTKKCEELFEKLHYCV